MTRKQYFEKSFIHATGITAAFWSINEPSAFWHEELEEPITRETSLALYRMHKALARRLANRLLSHSLAQVKP